jgi:TDG/mug DNA glycosylase family protein
MPRLPDYLRPGLDLVFVGINPGLRSWETGHHYAGRGNHFWPLLFESGLVGERLTYEDDSRVLEWGIGLTNMVARASASSGDLSAAELRAGAKELRRKLIECAPRVVCFNGKGIYEVFAGHRCELGAQAERLGPTRIFVMPSTSARTASHQRVDKLRYFQELARVVRAPARGVAAS